MRPSTIARLGQGRSRGAANSARNAQLAAVERGAQNSQGLAGTTQMFRY